MTKNELKELLKDNSVNEKHKINASAFVNIGLFVPIKLEMDKRSFDLYYEIDIGTLINSKLPNEEYEVLKDQGWSVVGEKIIVYII
jgi:hypothetical protein